MQGSCLQCSFILIINCNFSFSVVSTATVYGCRINGKFFQKTIQLSSCLFCECNVDQNNITCFKVDENETRNTVCTNCPSRGPPTSVNCPFCQHPFNTSIRIPLGNIIDVSGVSKCINCQCTNEGKVICRYQGFKDPICNEQDCDWRIKKYPKENCTHCIAPFTREKKIPGKHWFKYNPDYFGCTCLENGYLDCTTKYKYTSVGAYRPIKFVNYTAERIEELFKSAGTS